jgi:DNA-binding transcriptional regulator YiaG
MNSNTNSNLSRIDLRTWRKERDITREALAARLGVSVSALRNWERGTAQPSRMARRRIEEVCGALSAEEKSAA